jgi:hypothetical protein
MTYEEAAEITDAVEKIKNALGIKQPLHTLFPGVLVAKAKGLVKNVEELHLKVTQLENELKEYKLEKDKHFIFR